jgi:surface antigen
MKQLRVILLPALLTASACAPMDERRHDAVHSGEVTGTVVGGIIGGVIGHQFGDGRVRTASTVIGAALGALIGGELARDRHVSEYERHAAYRAFESAPTGHPVEWRDADRGWRGSYTPLRTYRSRQGNYCRSYEQFIYIDGREHRAYGTACRQPDGSWRIVN